MRLPIANQASEIVTAIQQHQVVVVKGNTGCGKTTQVPQFILDSMVANHCGADCNIVVTQVSLVCRFSRELFDRVFSATWYFTFPA